MDFTQLLATGEAENNSCPSASNPAVPHASQAHGHMEPDEVHGEAVRPVDEEGGAVWQPFEHAEEERILKAIVAAKIADVLDARPEHQVAGLRKQTWSSIVA